MILWFQKMKCRKTNKKTRTSIPTSTSAACFGFDKKANKIERRASHKISCGKNRLTLHEFFFGEKGQISQKEISSQTTE